MPTLLAPVHVEVCVDSVESAMALVRQHVYNGGSTDFFFLPSAIQGGATRLELCGNLGIGGGTTPSIGLLRSVKKVLPEVNIMVSFWW